MGLGPLRTLLGGRGAQSTPPPPPQKPQLHLGLLTLACSLCSLFQLGPDSPNCHFLVNTLLPQKCRELKRANLIHKIWRSAQKDWLKLEGLWMKNQYQLNMRMIYSLSTQTLYLKKTVYQAKWSKLFIWGHGKVFTWEWYVRMFAHFCFMGFIHS